jgi:hypothetical protein
MKFESYDYLNYEEIKKFLEYLLKNKWKITIKRMDIEK